MSGPRKFRIPANPVVSASTFSDAQVDSGISTKSVLHDRKPLFVTSGRIALARILREIGVEAGGKVLVPAYHCLSIILPIQHIGGDTVFYRVNADLSPDLEDLESKLTGDVRCVVFVHYFGFPLQIDRLAEFARQRSLLMIEDCAHAFFGTYEKQALGTFGDYAICSPWKFLPLFDGGCALSSEERFLDDNLRGGGIRFQAKVLINFIENSTSAGRFGIAGGLARAIFRLKDRLRVLTRSSASDNGAGSAPQSAHGSAIFESQWLDVRMSRLSQWMIRRSSPSRVVAKRRENYRRFLQEFPAAESHWPLYPALPDDVVPYVFPLYVRHGDAVYMKLRELGIPAFRWDTIPEGECETSSNYRTRLVQLPIHQELTPAELDQIVAGVKEALSVGEQGGTGPVRGSRQCK